VLMSHKSWDSIYTSKYVGGLRIKKMYDINRAPITKLGPNSQQNSNNLWKINPNSNSWDEKED
jgi:hypothetical protein